MSIAYIGALRCAGDSAAARGQGVQRQKEWGSRWGEEGNDLTGIMRCILCCAAVPLTQLLSETWFNLHIHFERAFSLELFCG